MLNDQIPVGYYSLFREMADVLVHLINSEFKLDPHSVPDISVGHHWGKYWEDNGLASRHGERLKFPHTYPENFPQSKAGPVPAWIYPNDSLGSFRTWLHTIYVTRHLEPYLQNKVKQGALPAPQVEQILLSVKRPELPIRH